MENIDLLWVLLCAALVFMMQMGFLSLETGLTRSKNNINVATKNMADFSISTLLFWGFGFALMFGTSEAGWLGTSDFLLDFSLDNPDTMVFFVFQVMFCGTAITIMSGAVAERMHFVGYLIVAGVVAGLVYPVFGHWAWNGIDTGTATGWLKEQGFVDFAGSTVVHSVGGWAALAVLLVIGPRTGRFAEDGTPRQIPGSNLPLAVLGTLLLWFGWFGFNGGSTLAFNSQAIYALLNTVIAGSSGLLGGLVLSRFYAGRVQVHTMLNGVLGGLVAITASANSVEPEAAFLIGLLGAVIMMLCVSLLERLRIDDAVGAVPAHLGAGIWGTLAVGIFADLDRLGTGLTRIEQIGVQGLGIVVCGVWTFGVTYLVVSIFNRFKPLRVTPEQEQIGLNIAEHNARTDLLDLFAAMDEQAASGDVSKRVPVEPFTEVGRIAVRYNAVMDALEGAILRTDAIIRNAMDAIITFTHDTFIIQSMNPAAEVAFGVSESQAKGRPLTSLLADTSGELGTLFQDLAGSNNHRELQARREDGSVFPVEVAVSRGEINGEPFYAGTFRDISERKRAREAEQRQLATAEALHQIGLVLNSTLDREKLLAFIENILLLVPRVLPHDSASIWLEDTIGVWRVVANVGFDQHGADTREKLAELRFSPSENARFRQIIEHEMPVIIPDTGQDATWVDLPDMPPIYSWAAAPIVVENRVIGALMIDHQQRGFYNDSHRTILEAIATQISIAVQNARLYERMAEYAARAEAASEAKSAFLANVSHELRTPLTSVIGFANIIKKRLDQNLIPNVEAVDKKTERAIKQVTANIDIIISEGSRLTSLINDVLDLAKIEAGKLDWHMKTIGIGGVIEQATAATTSLFDEKNLPLHVHIEEDLPQIVGDHDRLVQVIINLVSNAVKFTDEGHVTVRAERVDDELRVSVIDTGPGIAPKDHQTVFEQFRQVGDTLTDKPKGTGLGLPICKQIVEYHGGKLWLESDLGQGSTFMFSLPIRGMDDAAIRPIDLNTLVEQLKEDDRRAAASDPARAKTILVVDDEAPIRELLRQELEPLGYRVIEAQNGRQGIEVAKSSKPDLIVLDVMMPEMNGFDVAAVLRYDPETMDIPIIILSIVRDYERGHRLGVDRYFTKPINTEALLTEIDILISQGPSRRQVMIFDQDVSVVNMLSQVLQERGYNLLIATDNRQFLEKVSQSQPDVIIAKAAYAEEHDLIRTLRVKMGLDHIVVLLFE